MNRMRALFPAAAAAILSIVGATATAQTIVIQNARLHTGGPQGVIENGDVILRDGLIAAVGADLVAPEGATVINASGRVITPGFIAPYSQLGILELSLDAEANDAAPIEGFRYGAALNVADAYNPTSSVIAINRAGGVTRALTAPVPGDTIFAGRGAVIDLSSRVASVTKPDAVQFAALGYEGALRAGDTRMGSWAVLRRYLNDATSYAQNPRDFLIRRSEDRAYISELAALQPVVSGAQPLMVAADSAHELRNVIRLKNDFSLNVIVLGGAEGWRVARDLAAAGIPVVLDPLVNLPQQFEELGATLANAARLQAAGVEIGFYNSQSGITHNLRLLPQLAGNAVANGLPYAAAIDALTIWPARMFGLEARLGSLEPGKAGDLVVWDGDPLELSTRPVAVFIDGRAMSMENRQTIMRDRYRDLSRGDLPHAYRGAE